VPFVPGTEGSGALGVAAGGVTAFPTSGQLSASPDSDGPLLAACAVPYLTMKGSPSEEESAGTVVEVGMGGVCWSCCCRSDWRVCHTFTVGADREVVIEDSSLSLGVAGGEGWEIADEAIA
jgi:hypothetical protein